jgi:hypothetical protein
MSNDEIYRDMQNHFMHKLRLAEHDIGTSCEAVDMEPQDIVSMIVSVIAYEMVRLTVGMGMDENQFAALCRSAYRDLAPEAKKEVSRSQATHKPPTTRSRS